MPKWFKAGAVIFGLLSIGASSGKFASDFADHRALVAEVRLLREEVEKQTCIQVAQLRHSDWTLCLVPNAH